ncbi:MAG: BrnT family toxin [Anaerolineae bacterium]|nr:BrnT family toxin [Anaerolineae bacterium]
MKPKDLIWLPDIVDKLIEKHGVEPDEVEEVFAGQPRTFRGPKGHYPGEDVYYALGQTEVGRYLFVVFIRKMDGRVLVLSARDMTTRERRQFSRK